MKVSVNKDICVGCQMCVSICPDCFEMGKDNKAKVKKECESSPSLCCDEAGKSCPVGAIEIK